jgi:glycerol kinase
MLSYILGIDQGTTSSRAVLFDKRAKPLTSAQEEFPQHFPQEGWVEHDPEDIFRTVLSTCRSVIKKQNIDPKTIAGIGISNQRETTVVWERSTGKAIYPAIVWQDRRTAQACELLKHSESMVSKKTGLLIDPYFSATKIAWILTHVKGARERAEKGELAFGTIDSFLSYRLTGGKFHVTDATNASRTLLFNIHTQSWDEELLTLFDIPKALLPMVKDNAAEFGFTVAEFFGAAIPIRGMVGDQQSALIGQTCFQEGMAKTTYGTGCFMVYNTGEKILSSGHRLLSTTAYRFNGKATYALEGSSFVAGAGIQWLKDGLHLIEKASQTESLIAKAKMDSEVYLVPAFTGLGAPYWQPSARGAIMGLTRDTGIAEIVRAALEAVAYQTYDLIAAMKADGVSPSGALRVDGGMVVNHWLMQFLADIIQMKIERPSNNETSVLGAAYVAGLQAGLFNSLEELTALWQLNQEFIPNMESAYRHHKLQGWQKAVERVLL